MNDARGETIATPVRVAKVVGWIDRMRNRPFRRTTAWASPGFAGLSPSYGAELQSPRRETVGRAGQFVLRGDQGQLNAAETRGRLDHREDRRRRLCQRVG